MPEASRAVSGVSASRSAELPQAQGCRGKERRMRLHKVKEKARYQISPTGQGHQTLGSEGQIPNSKERRQKGSFLEEC